MLPLALDVQHLSVVLRDRTILNDISFAVPAGTTTAIIGPNGAGKTVLLRALIGALPSTGLIHWAAGTRLGYVPQKLDIDRDVPVTAGDFLRAHPARPRSITDLVTQVGLPPQTVDYPIGELSGGQFQRLLVAFALAGSPTVLLLDEPTAGVDEPGEERLLELVRRHQRERGLTVLLISHELTVVARDAANVLCLSPGRAWFGPPRHVLTPALLEELYGATVAIHRHDA